MKDNDIPSNLLCLQTVIPWNSWGDEDYYETVFVIRVPTEIGIYKHPFWYYYTL